MVQPVPRTLSARCQGSETWISSRLTASHHHPCRVDRLMAPAYSAVHVFGDIKDGCDDFWDKTVANAKASALEDGIARFDVLRELDKPNSFCLIEVYKTAEAPAAHKQTTHFRTWLDAVTPMMAHDRTYGRYDTIFPEPSAWDVEASVAQDTSTAKGTAGGAAAVEKEGGYGQLGGNGLLVVLVDIQVKPGTEDAFTEETLLNCRLSVTEGGISRFDLIQGKEDKCNFVLVEVYNSAEGPVAHKASAHWPKWRTAVEDMMARPRQSRKFNAVFPERAHWHRTECVTHARATMSSPSSLNAFEFGGPGSIVFGVGTANQLPALVKGFETDAAKTPKPFIATGSRGAEGAGRLGEIIALLKKDVGACEVFAVREEPTIGVIQAAVEAARAAGCDVVVGLGGGSVIDAGKAVACLLANEGEVMDYIEVIGKGKKITNPSKPFIAVPTTAGTGSEVTKNAVVKSEEANIKASLRSAYMMPNIALIDPELTVSCPPFVTACVGLDALTQCIEPFVSNKANPFTDALAREGIVRASRSLRQAYRNGQDLSARQDMCIASVLGGLSLANAKLGVVHGFAGPIGGMFAAAPHGGVCGALLPHCYKANVTALEQAGAEYAEALERHREVARLLTSNPAATTAEGAAWLFALVKDLNIQGLSSYGLESKHEAEVVRLSAKSSSMKGNPIVLSEAQLAEILVAAR